MLPPALCHLIGHNVKRTRSTAVAHTQLSSFPLQVQRKTTLSFSNKKGSYSLFDVVAVVENTYKETIQLLLLLPW
jgi:hypothetical protein